MNSFLVVILFLFAFINGNAQNQSFDKTKWNKLRKTIKYSKKTGSSNNYSQGGSRKNIPANRSKRSGRTLQDTDNLSEPGDYGYEDNYRNREFDDKFWKDVEGYNEDESDFNEFLKEHQNDEKYSESEDEFWKEINRERKEKSESNYSDFDDNNSESSSGGEFRNWRNTQENKNISVVDENVTELPEIEEKNLELDNLDSGRSTGLGAMGSFLKVVLIILLVLVIAYVAYKIYLNYLENKTIKSEEIVEITEDIAPTQIPKTALQKALEEAIARKDYREAVRVYFIFIIKDLSEKDWIDWEKEKTNYTYLREMQEREVFQDFSNSVNIFEVVWYGKRNISDQDFKSVRPIFVNLLNKLGVK